MDHLPGSKYLYKLEFFCMEDLSVHLIYLYAQSSIYISMGSWIFILYFDKIKHYFINFAAQIKLTLAPGSCFHWLPCPLRHTPIIVYSGWVCVCLLFRFFFSWHYKMFQAQLAYLLPALVTESAISPKRSNSFDWKMVLRIKIWTIGMLIVIAMSLLLGSLSW